MTETTANIFQTKATETLEEKAFRICETIILCGIGIRGGQITNGGNMVKVRNAVSKISDAEIAILRNSGNHREDVAGYIIKSMKKFLDTNISAHRDETVNALVILKRRHDWQTDAKPLNWDLNAVGAKQPTYREPEGVAKELVEAFDIGFKNPSLPEPLKQKGVK
jgi:hypothetical protein